VKLAELIARIEERARLADLTGSVAPVANVCRLFIRELGQLDGLETAGRWLDTAEAADVLGVSEKTVRRWCGDGRFPSARKTSGDTGEWRIPAAEVYRQPGHEEGGGEAVPRLWREKDE
jgi:excisionase family DNA binding protein